MKVFIIMGYGVPNDIHTDDNYRRYLGVAFNTVFEQAADQRAAVILCGGKTDIRKPYKRTEAKEMSLLFKEWMSRKECRSRTKQWKLMLEQTSLSSVESLMNCRALLDQKGITADGAIVFCEMTRRRRISTLVKRVFKGLKPSVAPVDFDLSPNRYLADEFIAAKEKKTLIVEQKALSDAKFLKEYRRVLEERIARFRKAGPEAHLQEIKKWWEERLDDLVEEAR